MRYFEVPEPPTAMFGPALRALDDFGSRLAREAEKYAASPDLLFGMEARAAFRVLRAGDVTRQAANLRRFLLRPGFEPILYSYLDDEEGLERCAEQFVSSVLGRHVVFRDHEIAYGREFPQVKYQFPAGDRGATWRAKLAGEAGAATVSNAFVRLALSNICHAFPDGNGRLGRAIFFSTIKDLAFGPAVPLGPAMYLHAEAVRLAFFELAARGDWSPYLACMHQVMETALELAERLQAPAIPSEGREKVRWSR